MMKRFYYWMMKKAGHPHARWYLGAISFAESSISPFPPDPLMVPMVLQDKRHAWSIAFLTTATSAIGGMVGYAIGLFLFEKLGMPILEAYGLQAKFLVFQETFYRWGFWAIVIKAFTPIPFKLVTITCGALKFDFLLFVVASTLSRGLRFYIVAGLLKRFGPHMQAIIEKNISLVAWTFIGVLIAGFFLVKYVV
jgi:membrane protein YqaA with SNARE-associated domain